MRPPSPSVDGTLRIKPRKAAEFKRVRRAWRVTLWVKVLWPGKQRRRQGEGQGRRREVGLKEAQSETAGR
jgi:hypothetical protein